MGKKISIFLVAMLCLSMLPWTSIGIGSDIKNVKNAEPLKVDAWVESKLAKPGDTINIYANTSYITGVSVSADIMEYEHNEDVIASLSLENLDISGMIYTTYISTVSLTYDSTEKHWVGEYTIPSSSAGAFYVADVKATDGVNTANDNATVHLYKFYDEHLKPVQDSAETFLYGEFNDTVNDIKENLTALNDTINAHGGIRGIVENLIGLHEWQTLLDAGYQEHEETPVMAMQMPYQLDPTNYPGVYISMVISAPQPADETDISWYIADGDGVTQATGSLVWVSCWSSTAIDDAVKYECAYIDNDGNGMLSTADIVVMNESKMGITIAPGYMLKLVYLPTNSAICYVTFAGKSAKYDGTTDGYYETKDITAFLDNLTKFILSDEYENIKSMIPELKSFILGIPTEPDMMIDYLLGFNLTQYLNKIEGTEGVVAAYNALLSSEEYSDFEDALQMSETYWNQENLSIAIMDLFMSDEMMNMLNATAEYLQGNDTALQNLINSFVALDGNFNSQLEALMKLPEFQNLKGAAMGNANLSQVVESINTTFNNINNSVREMMNSTQFQDLQASIENLQEYMMGGTIGHWRSFSGNETFNYNYTVKDWMKELCVDLDPYFYGYYDFINDTWVSGTGNIIVTLTDPNDVVYTYTESYSGTGYYMVTTGMHDYIIPFPASGNWTINVATSGGDGNYNLNIGPRDDFMTYMLKESMEEIFFVLNAGVAIETEYFQTTGSTGSAKLIAYDADGRIANEEINVIVSRNTGGMAGATGIIPAAILYVWVSGMTVSGGMAAPVMSASCSSYPDGSTKITICSVSQTITLEEVEWYLLDSNYIKCASGEISALGYTDQDITVTWYDNDGDGKLSTGDDFKIYKEGNGLAGYHFRFMYKPTSSIMNEMVICSKNTKDTYYDGAYKTEEVSSSFEALPYIKQMMEQIKPGIVYEGKVTTESNGEVTINFPVEEFGIYTIDAYFEDENRIGFGESAFIGESYVPEIGLTQIGKFAGIPVYMNPNKIGENITFNVNIPENENASVAIAPLPLNELFPDINMSYGSSDTTITGPESVSLQVNGPVSLIAVATGIPFGPEEKEEETPAAALSTPSYSYGYYTTTIVAVSTPVPTPDVKWYVLDTVGVLQAGGNTLIPNGNSTNNDISVYMYDNDANGKLSAGDTLRIWDTTGKIQPGWNFRLGYVPTGNTICIITFAGKSARYNGISPEPSYLFSIPQFNISFGILLTSNVSVTLDGQNILKGERFQLGVSTTGTPVITYGFAYYANGLDIMSLDVTTLSKMLYESAVFQKEPNITDIMGLMNSMICGPGNAAFVTIPKLAVDGNYSIITVTNVDGKLGSAFTPVYVYTVSIYIQSGTPVNVTGTISVNVPLTTATQETRTVKITCSGNGTLTVNSVTMTPPPGKKDLGIFVDIDFVGTFEEAFITVHYNDTDIPAGVNEEDLRMYYLNETTNEWVVIPDSGVWTDNNTVWARVTHLTIFAPMAEEVAAAPVSMLLSPIYLGVIAAIIAVLIISVAVVARKRKK